MRIKLEKKDLENIKSYRYKTNGLTPVEVHLYDPFWTFIANNLLPDNLAPNLLTIMGLIVPFMCLIAIVAHDWTFTQVVPNWVILLGVAALFWYQTVDAIDGKQARRIDNCSPLGQLLDHNLDQITFTIATVLVCQALMVGDDVWRIMAIAPGVWIAHYSIEYRTHYTQWHIIVIGFIGATEQLIFQMLGLGFVALHPESNAVAKRLVNIAGYEISIGDIIILFALSTGVHYNLTNFYEGMKASPNKFQAALRLMPYIQFFCMVYLSSLSQFWQTYTLMFVLINGLFMTYVTGIFNLNSTAGMTFNWHFWEPYFYAVIIAFDVFELVPFTVISISYQLFALWIIVNYLLFMYDVINQLTTYLDIPFITVMKKKNPTNMAMNNKKSK